MSPLMKQPHKSDLVCNFLNFVTGCKTTLAKQRSIIIRNTCTKSIVYKYIHVWMIITRQPQTIYIYIETGKWRVNFEINMWQLNPLKANSLMAYDENLLRLIKSHIFLNHHCCILPCLTISMPASGFSIRAQCTIFMVITVSYIWKINE